MPKTQQELFNQIADALDPNTERSKEERMNLLLSALYDMNNNIKKNQALNPEAINASRLVRVIKETAHSENEGINAARGVLTAVMRDFPLYGFSEKMTPIFVNNLYKDDAQSIIPKGPIPHEKSTTNAYLVDFIRLRVKFVFINFVEKIGKYLDEINREIPQMGDGVPVQSVSKDLGAQLEFTKQRCEKCRLVENTNIKTENSINDQINTYCIVAINEIKSIIEDTDWKLGKWGSTSTIEVNGDKKQIPKHMKEIYDKIKHAEKNAYSDENEHPFWSNVNTCYFNALSQ